MYYQALVNKKYKYQYQKEMFLGRVLVPAVDVDGNQIEIEEKTYQAYLDLQKKLKEEENITIGICSGYRDEKTQQQIFSDFVSLYGEDYAKKTVAMVGCSEHHTGLCLDFSVFADGKFLVEHSDIMEYLEDYEKISSYFSKFGFILRYPKDKEKVTGYAYEPWHIRYVGKSLAEKLYQEGLTLEEYYQNISGILVVNKEKGMTSRDVVNLVGKYFYTKKVGHTGTLDPMAEGVLVITLGKATRISELLTSTYKEYIATAKLGIETDTLDITGTILNQCEIPKELPLQETLETFPKTYLQEVPAYSAVKVNGKKLYEYARENIEVSLPKKEVTIKKMELLNQQEEEFSFRCLVSKGTYVRSLIRDIGRAMNVLATMSKLQRTKQGIFFIEKSSCITDIKNGTAKLYSLKDALRDYPQISPSFPDERKVVNGQSLVNSKKIKGPCVLLDTNDQVLAIYQGKEDKLIAWKVLTTTKE